MIKALRRMFGIKKPIISRIDGNPKQKNISTCKKCGSPSAIVDFCNIHLEEWIAEQDSKHKQ